MNVVWIIIDSLRADRLGYSGYDAAHDAESGPDRAPGHPFCAMHQPPYPDPPGAYRLFLQHGCVHAPDRGAGRDRGAWPGLRLLPEMLRERGYFTAAVDNIGRWIEPAFEQYETYPRWDHDGSRPWRNGEQVTEKALRLLARCERAAPPSSCSCTTGTRTRRTCRPAPFDRMFYDGDEKDPRTGAWSRSGSRPGSRATSRSGCRASRDIEFVKAQYDAEVAYADSCVGRVVQAPGAARRPAKIRCW